MIKTLINTFRYNLAFYKLRKATRKQALERLELQQVTKIN